MTLQKLSLTLSLVGLALMPLSVSAATVEANGAINATGTGPLLSRNLYGQFSEHLGRGIYDGIWVGPDSKIPNVHGIRSDVVAALKALHVPVVRWPGGCFADEYNWRDGIGPREARPRRRNSWWGGKGEPSDFGTHEFMDFADQIGSDAYVSVNVGSSTPMEMRAWMEYLTSDGEDSLAMERHKNGHTAPYKVAVWGIGNEAWGCGGQMSAEHYADVYRQFTSFYHKNPSNAGLRVAVGPGDENTHWTEVMMREAGSLMDGLSIHHYTLPTGHWDKKGQALGFSRDEWFSTFRETFKMEDLIRNNSAIMDKYDPNKKVALYVDEWGTWYDQPEGAHLSPLYQQNSLRDALVAAVNFNIFHHHADRVKLAAIAQTINVLQAMILTDQDKIALTPTYHVFAMYMPFQDATAVPFTLNAPILNTTSGPMASLSASVARAKDGHVYVALANIDPDNGAHIVLGLKGLQVRTVSGQILTAKAMDAHNEPGKTPEVTPEAFRDAKVTANGLDITAPAKSVIVVKLD